MKLHILKKFKNFLKKLFGFKGVDSMERDFNNFMPPFMDFGMPPNPNSDDMFNPIAQYEQAYYYYKYLCKQMDYKIKCKEYEKLCGNDVRAAAYGRDRKPE